MGIFRHEAQLIFCAVGLILVEGAEILGRWSLDELNNGQLTESLSQNTSSTFLLARENATNTRLGVLSVEDVNHLSIEVPNGDCLVDSTACGTGLAVSFWLRFKGLISSIIGDKYIRETTLKGWLDAVASPGSRWVNCYRATEHGWDASTFHSRCDLKGPTVTLVKVDNSVFGGFTDMDWGGSTGYKKSDVSFLFTFGNTKSGSGIKLDLQDPSKAIYSNQSYGPCFGDGDLVISDMAGQNVKSSSRLGTSYLLPGDYTAGSVEAANLFAESEYFMPDELEVFHIECFHPLGMQSGDIADAQITQTLGTYKANDADNAPWQARLNNPTGNTWIAAQSSGVDLEIDLINLHRVIGIDVHGNDQYPSKHSYPTNFIVGYYSEDSSTFQTYLSGLSLEDASTIKRFLFVSSITTRKLKFSIISCYQECALAVEIYGCSVDSCDQALRLENITATSSKPSNEPSEGEVGLPRCWKPSTDSDPNDHLQVDLGRVKVLTGVVTEAASSSLYVEKYKIEYSIDGVEWKFYPNFDGTPKVFEGGSGLFTVTLEPVVQVRFVRFYPVSGDKCVKLQLLGCSSIKGEHTGILSSGSNPKDETGLMIYSSSNLYTVYHAEEQDCYSTADLLTTTEWTRFIFMLKDNYDTRIYLDGVKIDTDVHDVAIFTMNSAKVINLANSLSSFQSWSVENIQLSDLSVWKDHGWDSWAVALPTVLDLCDFDTTPCSWKSVNWPLAQGCAPSNILGTGPCMDRNGLSGFYLLLDSSYPRYKGESVRFESPYVISAYKCVTFWYHMWGEHVGRLEVSVRNRLWRLSGDQGNSWNEGKVKIGRNSAFKVVFEAVVGDGFLGDIAIDDIQLSTTSCQTSPSHAKKGTSESVTEYLALGMESGAISDAQISASSIWADSHNAAQGRLNHDRGWASQTRDYVANEWLQIDLGCGCNTVSRIATQGLTDYNNWLTAYKLEYGNDGVNFQYYVEQSQVADKVFTGNTDRNTVVSHDLNPPIKSRYIRFRPVYFYVWIAMRVELYTLKVSFIPGLQKSAIIGHLQEFNSFLMEPLSDAGVGEKIWIRCYRAVTDGRDVEEFYSRCGKVKTITIVRSGNYIFGGYTERNWNTSRENGAGVSSKAFLFSLNNKQGTGPIIFPIKPEKRHTAHPIQPGEGPTFGNGDLVLETMSSGHSQLGSSFGTAADAVFQFAEANNFEISDIEVLHTGDTLCNDECHHAEGVCDEITGKCVCDWSDRNVEWCLEGEPKKIIDLYQSATSYWALDYIDDIKDRARLGWGKAHGGVSLDPKGLSGQALQLDGATGWTDLGSLDTACSLCPGDFSISMWLKYYPKDDGTDQSFLTFNNGMTELEIYYNATLELVGVAINTASHTGSFLFEVHKGFWTHLGITWYNDSESIGIHKNGESLDAAITWNVCSACSASPSNTSVTLGAGSFPNASFDEIGIWLEAKEAETFLDIFNTYKGPERLHVELTLQFTSINWMDNFFDPESAEYTALLQNLRDEITTFYSSMPDVITNADNISLSKCWDDSGLVSCYLHVDYYSAGYKQLEVLLEDWLSNANLLGVSTIVLLDVKNDNVPGSPVSGLTANATGPTSINVSWVPPPDDEIPGILIGYVVYFKPASSDSDIWDSRQVFNTDEPYAIEELDTFTSYTIKVATVSLEGEGKATSLNASTQEGPPSRPPANVTYTNTTSTSISLRWDAPEGPIPGTIRGYRVFYARAPDVINQTNYITVDNETIIYYIAMDMKLMNVTTLRNVTEYNVTGLEPYTWYFLWVTAFTMSDSPRSHPVSWRTDESVPDQAPEITQVISQSSSECLLSWDPIPYVHYRGFLLGYRIVYTADDSLLNSSNITVYTNTYLNVSVMDLKPFTKYWLKVAGFTSVGDGNYSVTQECQTQEDVPSAPPENIEVYNVTKTSCEISWGPVPDEHQNGIIIGYELIYNMSSSVWQNVSLDANSSSYLITGLQSYTEYSISIVGVTSAGAGTHGDDSRLLCTTDADYPSASPTGLSVLDVTKSSCHFSWTAIPPEDANGEMISYEVHVLKTDSADQLPITMLVCGTATEANVTMLDVFSSYDIKVAFHNHIGSGNYSETLVCITGEAAPSLPPQNLRAHNTSSTSIMIYWDLVPEDNRHGIIREYHLHIIPLQDPLARFNDVDTSGILYKEFHGLQAYQNYSIQIAAKTVELGNYSEPIFVMTGEAAPQTAPVIVDAYNTSGRSIFVQWTPPLGPISGILRGYRIRYRNLNLSISSVEVSTADANTLSYEISWLETYSKYRIRVLAFTVADGPKSDAVELYTDKKILPPPDGIPEDIELNSKTATSCYLMWKAAENSITDPDGATQGYFIYYREAGSNDTFSKVDVQEQNQTSQDVVDLQEFMKYEFQVVAYNYYGEGNTSEIFNCFTDEAAPSEPPINVTEVQVTPRGIQIEWDLPQERDWNGIIRGFIIKYYRKDEGNLSAVFIDVPLSILNVQLQGQNPVRRRRATDLTWSLTDLEEYTTYVVQVLFYTVGNSAYSPIVEIQTAEDAPSAPPTGVSAVHNGSSTSLLITWSDVPDLDQNGVTRRFLIGYWLKDEFGMDAPVNVSKSSVVTPAKRRKRASGTSYTYVIEGLKIWTDYYVVVAAVTVGQGPYSEPLLVRTDEGVPCLPPQYVTYDVPGLTMLLARWKPVPEHCRNGVILGYRVKYQRLDGIYPARVENTTADILYAFLYDMDIYANYSIEISAFTSKGDGNATMDLALPDALGTKKTPINITAYNHTSTHSINFTWQPFDDEFILERMLGYRVSYRAVKIGDEYVEEDEVPTFNFTTRKTTLSVVIEGLDSYTLYQINVSGFSRKGDGPSAITGGETCRCEKRLATNYRLFPPYVAMRGELTGGGHLTVANLTGMLPKILDDLVVTCCQTCLSHGKSNADFMYNGTNGTAIQDSEQEMKSLIEDRNDISFPVYGWKWQEYYSAYYRYIPLVESPGVAFITIEKEGLTPSQRLINEVFGTWPYIVITTFLAVLAGIVIWFLDAGSNPDQFPRTFLRGSGNGFWWAFISMTTLGYGDKVPKANVSKAFAIIWILIGLVIMGILSGALTTAVTMFVFETDIMLYGTKVAAIKDTPEYRLAVQRNARVNEEKSYTTFSQVYDALINEEVQGMLIDTYEAGYRADQFKDPRIRIHTIFDFKSTYGVVLAGNSTKLLQCSKSYMQAHKDEMFEHISQFVHTIMEEHVPESVEVSSGLFDAQNDVFKYSAIFMGACLAWAIMIGCMWEYRRKVRIQEAEQREGHADVEKTKELLQEMKKFVGDFYCNFKANYSRLSTQHRLQLKALKTQLSNKQTASSGSLNTKQSFFNETYVTGMSPPKGKKSCDFEA